MVSALADDRSPGQSAVTEMMSYGWFGGDSFPWIQIVTMIAWTVALTPLAVKLFKWR